MAHIKISKSNSFNQGERSPGNHRIRRWADPQSCPCWESNHGSSVAPARTSVAPARTSIAPALTSVAPARTSVHPARNQVTQTLSSEVLQRASYLQGQMLGSTERQVNHKNGTWSLFEGPAYLPAFQSAQDKPQSNAATVI